jgi:hypothetical protein
MQWIKENIDQSPSFAPYQEAIGLIEQTVTSNPTLCVETCKSLVEGICKTILTNKNIPYAADISFQGLTRQTIESIINLDDGFREDLAELGRRIASVAQKLAEIRNNNGFAGHGMDVLNPRLTETVSLFAYKITDTVAGFILNCYINNRAVNTDHRIHYKDCFAFNEYFDDLNPMQVGVVRISASEALFNQDYEAYKESYFDYLEDLKNNDEQADTEEINQQEINRP